MRRALARRRDCRAHARTPRNGNIIHMFMILTEHSERETFTVSSRGASAHSSVFRRGAHTTQRYRFAAPVSPRFGVTVTPNVSARTLFEGNKFIYFADRKSLLFGIPSARLPLAYAIAPPTARPPPLRASSPSKLLSNCFSYFI